MKPKHGRFVLQRVLFRGLPGENQGPLLPTQLPNIPLDANDSQNSNCHCVNYEIEDPTRVGSKFLMMLHLDTTLYVNTFVWQENSFSALKTEGSSRHSEPLSLGTYLTTPPSCRKEHRQQWSDSIVSQILSSKDNIYTNYTGPYEL